MTITVDLVGVEL